MASFGWDIQQKIFSTLDTGLSYNVYDNVPALPEGMPQDKFPYVVIGDDTFVPFDDDDQVGVEGTLTIHVWSRYKGRKETKVIQGEIYTLLNRASLPITGYNIVDSLFEFSETFVENDGEYRHGVQRFRLTLQRT